ncbi:MAG: hypothetical protein D6761_08240 [Candidatus Dadabacteria bacterium]|nr:MAG: hypothetical protein D6761_08240 [Candidatus Dadabacteria bacterium]
MPMHHQPLRAERFVLSLLTAFVFATGYLFIRTAWDAAASVPFAQEIVLIALSVIATVLITALLLNRQTEVELNKEQRLRHFEARERLYERVFQTLQQIIDHGQLSHRDVMQLQLFTNHLAMLSSSDVLVAWNRVIDELTESWLDRQIDLEEARRLSQLLAQLSLAMRVDLLGSAEGGAQVAQHIVDNAQGVGALQIEERT